MSNRLNGVDPASDMDGATAAFDLPVGLTELGLANMTRPYTSRVGGGCDNDRHVSPPEPLLSESDTGFDGL